MNYSENNIETLDFMTAVRTRPAMYIDAIVQHGLFKIDSEPFQNACDEVITGNASICLIHYDTKTGMMSCKDDGRGIPIGKLHEVLTVPHTGGKFIRNLIYHYLLLREFIIENRISQFQMNMVLKKSQI